MSHPTDRADPHAQPPHGHGPHQGQQRYTFSVDEVRALKDCNRESFYYRCLPLAALSSAAVIMATKNGILAPHPRFGPTIKVLGASFLSFIVGKISYQSVCEEKLMAIPNSMIGKMIRQKRGLPPLEDTGINSVSEFEDTPIAPAQGIEQVSFNGPVDYSNPQEQSAAPRYRTFDDLRRQNRERVGPQPPAPAPSIYTANVPLPPNDTTGLDTASTSQSSPGPWSDRNTFSNQESYASTPVQGRSQPSMLPKKKNQYGDTWEE